jgi:hypothetical protein
MTRLSSPPPRSPADSASVKWDDRITIDFWPTRALKKLL